MIPFSEPKVYLSVDADTEVPFRIVKIELTQRDEVLKFLKELGIPEFDSVVEVLDLVLPKYTRPRSIITVNENRRDLKKIERAMRHSPKLIRLRKQLDATPFILCTVPAKSRREFRRACKAYFRSDDLCEYFKGNGSFAYVELDDHVQRTLFKELGVADSVRILSRSPDLRGYVQIHSSHGFHSRGLNGYDPNIFVDGLREALVTPTVSKSAFIWNTIVIPNVDCIRGIVESSSRKDYVRSTQKEQISISFGGLLIDREWLPDSSGRMHRPCDLRLDDLHHTFERRHMVAEKLAMKTDAVAEPVMERSSQQQRLDIARRIQEASREDRQRIYKILDKEDDRERPEFPRAVSADPIVRKQRSQIVSTGAVKKASEKRPRRVRYTRGVINPQTTLREWYTNRSEQMVCQICKDEMPFKKRDGEYYFEAVEVLSEDYLPREHESQYLALCPLCAAKYKEFVKREDSAMKEVCRALMESNKLEVQLTLGTSIASVRFVQKHFIDLQEILKVQRLSVTRRG